jgi:hypothetical protein
MTNNLNTRTVLCAWLRKSIVVSVLVLVVVQRKSRSRILILRNTSVGSDNPLCWATMSAEGQTLRFYFSLYASVDVTKCPTITHSILRGPDAPIQFLVVHFSPWYRASYNEAQHRLSVLLEMKSRSVFCWSSFLQRKRCSMDILFARQWRNI